VRRKQAEIREILRHAIPADLRERIYSVELIHKCWARAVGYELALRSEPEALSGGVLTVRVTDVRWGKMIYKLQDRIIPQLNRELGGRLIRRLNFTKRSQLVRPGPDAEPIKKEREVLAPPETLSAAAQGIQEPELKELVLQAASHYLKAQENRRRK